MEEAASAEDLLLAVWQVRSDRATLFAVCKLCAMLRIFPHMY